MEYLRIRSWSKYQDTAGNRNIFVKLDPLILTDPEFMCLDDRYRLQFVLLLCYAGLHSNKIPNDANALMRLCYFDTEVDLEPLIRLGYLEPWCEEKHNAMLEQYHQQKQLNREKQRKYRERKKDNQDVTGNVTLALPRITPKTETETKTETKTETIKPIVHPKPKKQDEQRESFEIVWSLYPDKKGKEKAWLKFKNQVKSDQDYVNITIALDNYKKEVARIRGSTQPDLNYQNGSTWFNHNWKDYIDYKPPEGSDKWANVEPEYE